MFSQIENLIYKLSFFREETEIKTINKLNVDFFLCLDNRDYLESELSLYVQRP